MFLLPPALMDAPDSGSTNTRCTVEEVPTEHVWAIVTPDVEDEEVDPLKLLQMSKRLMCCTSCGNLRLMN